MMTLPFIISNYGSTADVFRLYSKNHSPEPNKPILLGSQLKGGFRRYGIMKVA